MCKLAIVILNWNGSDMMRRYLPSVIRCSRGEGIEVIVADNASSDDSISMLHSCFPDLRIIQLDQNYGFADGYNRSLRQVEAEYYLLLNSDVEIRQDGWLTPMIDFMDRHPQVSACQPKLLKLLPQGEEKTMFEYAGAAGGFIDQYGYPFCRGRVFATVEDDRGQYDEVASVMWTTGAAMTVRSNVYWEAGGLDAQFFAHMEEIDLCWRMRIMGYDLVCVPQSTAYHLGGATLNQGNPRKTFLNFRNNLLMLYKNLPEQQLRSVIRMRRFLDFVAAVQFLVKGDLANMKAIRKAHKEFATLIPYYAPIRQHIQAQRNLSQTLPELVSLSILWQYYVRRRKTFSQLLPSTSPS
ncbi:MAG: glycosyltransferase family 2 protein [Bacteroidaceae bacterium]|nr:glycosyltransferase family 2 protein [Bacteroidaceae bacterium]